jgi:hypothetical protein
MKKTMLCLFLMAVLLLQFSCKKTCANGSQVSNSSNCDTTQTSNGGASLTGTFSKPGPSGSGINFVIIIDDNAKTTKIGYNNGGGFMQTQTGSYTRTTNEITITDGSCPGVQGIYRFTITATNLTMLVINDNCVDANFGGNRADAVAGIWSRQ